MTNKLKSADMMPGKAGLPLIGNTIDAITKQELFYWQQHQQHGNVFKVSLPILFGNIACLIGPEANRFILKDGADRLSSRSGNKGLEPILTTDTILLKDGEEHRTSRKMIYLSFIGRRSPVTLTRFSRLSPILWLIGVNEARSISVLS
jgi:retinoid hydroxylase